VSEQTRKLATQLWQIQNDGLSAEQKDFFPWTENEFYQELFSPQHIIFLFEENFSGFVLYRSLESEVEIMQLSVSPKYKGNGIFLLEKFFKSLSLGKSKIERIFLEVSEKNSPALKCYRHVGFEEISRRARYYKDGSSAIVMQKRIGL